MNLTKRLGGFTVAAMTVIALTLTGCSQSKEQPADAPKSDAASATKDAKDSKEAAAWPVTIKHALGETVIKEQPKRIATISWMNDDVVMSLGVVPVGVPAIPKFKGGNEHQSYPWKDKKLKELGAFWGTPKAPKQYMEKPGQIPYQDIAAVKPDLIVASYSGLKQEEYQKLSQIAPTLAYPKHPWGTHWDEATRQIGKALGLSDKAEEVIKQTNDSFAKVQKDHPDLVGKTFIAARLNPQDSKIALYTSNDNRPLYLQALGLKMADVAAEATKGGEKYYKPFPAEKADQLKSDIFISWVFKKPMVEQIKTNPLLSKIPEIANGSAIITADTLMGVAVGGASPLSIPWANEKYVPLLEKALKSK